MDILGAAFLAVVATFLAVVVAAIIRAVFSEFDVGDAHGPWFPTPAAAVSAAIAEVEARAAVVRASLVALLAEPTRD